MDMTKEEREALLDEFRAAIKAENKTDIDKINALIAEKLGGPEQKALQDKIDELETKMGRLPISSSAEFPKDSYMAGFPSGKVESNPMPLTFIDSAGVEHKALRFDEKLFKGKEEDFSIGKILAAKITGSAKNLNNFEMKAIGENVGAAGGFLLAEEVSSRLIDLSRNLMCVMKAGAQTLPMSVPELRLVKVASDPTATFRAEHSAIGESQWSLEPINLVAMSCGVLCRVSREILADAANAGTMLQNAMAQALALAQDRVSLIGDGVTEPRGISNCAGINKISMGVNGAVFTNYDPFSNGVEDIADNNGEANSTIMSPRSFFALDRLKAATTNQPLVPPQSFIDLKKFKTNQIGNTDTWGTSSVASKAFVGDFRQLLFGIRQTIEVEITTQGGTGTFAQVEALIRAVMRFDIAVLRENHFCLIEGIL